MYSVMDTPTLPGWVPPFGNPRDQSLFSGSPRLIAANHVLHRHLERQGIHRLALSSLAINFFQVTNESMAFARLPSINSAPVPYSVVKEQWAVRPELQSSKLKGEAKQMNFNFPAAT